MSYENQFWQQEDYRSAELAITANTTHIPISVSFHTPHAFHQANVSTPSTLLIDHRHPLDGKHLHHTSGRKMINLFTILI
jgi:hypothetical protein